MKAPATGSQVPPGPESATATDEPKRAFVIGMLAVSFAWGIQSPA